MSNVYREKPNIVHVYIKDKTGKDERHIVGKTLAEVIAIFEPESPSAAPRKYRKPRRTADPESAVRRRRAQPEHQETEGAVVDAEITPDPAAPKSARGRTWPE